MSKKMSKRKKAIIRRRIFLSCTALVLVSVIALSVFIINSLMGVSKNPSPSSSKDEVSSQSKPVIKEQFATVLSIGDIMVHSTQLDGAYVSSTKEYDFSAFFKETSAYYQKADLAVGNLEVTFGGTEAGKYRGYPVFNTPDSLADAIKNSGLNFILTSNNHSNDTGLNGIKRTVQVLKDRGLEFIGTRETAEEEIYTVKDVNGIKIGMADYTYETSGSKEGRKYLNGTLIAEEANDLVASFNYDKIDTFYAEAESVIADMKQKGAEFIVFYLHWGNEYKTSPNTRQKSIAQKLSNLGVDMIIGSHPHVVQPIELIRAEGGEHTTICLYSSGNAVSNQRKELMDSCPTGHTEDGTMLTYTLRKYGDEITVTDVDIIPTWVNKYKGGAGYQYTIYPLESADWANTKYGFDSATAAKAQKSFERTKAIVANGLTEIQKHIGCEVTFE